MEQSGQSGVVHTLSVDTTVCGGAQAFNRAQREGDMASVRVCTTGGQLDGLWKEKEILLDAD